MDMTWLEKRKNRTAWLLLLALFWCGSHHVAPKWDYMCMKQELEHSPTIHQSLVGPVWKFVHVYSAGKLTVLMRVWMCKGVIKCVGVQYESVCVCLCILWGLVRRANGASTLQPLHHPARQAHAQRHAWEGFNILCVCVPVLLCLLKECSSLYLYACLVITYSLPTHAFRGRWSLKARAMLYFHLLKTHDKLSVMRQLLLTLSNRKCLRARHWELLCPSRAIYWTLLCLRCVL